MSPAFKSRNLAFATASCLMAALPAQAALTATTSTHIPAARAAFLSQATVLGAYDWSSKFPPNTHVMGTVGALIMQTSMTFTASDGATNTIQGTNFSLSPANWLDGPGFNSADGLSAAADLAIGGPEDFNLVFGSPYTSVGMAVATGLSNLPNEVDLLGASFNFVALDALGQAIGTASLVLPAGPGNAACVTLVSSAPMHSLQVRETAAATLRDQYFSNIYATPANVTAVPEPASWLMMALGLSGLGCCGRKRASTRFSITPR